MKNMLKMIGAIRSIAIIALVTIIGFAACGGDEGNDGDTSGKLTITGLDAFNGKYAIGFFDDDNNSDVLWALGNYTQNAISGGKINDGSVTLNVYSGFSSYSSFNGNRSNVEFVISIFETSVYFGDPAPERLAYGHATVTFVNGIGTAAFVLKEEN